MLTSATFPDPAHGWAAGHESGIIATADGGETWALQRFGSDVDRPLFSVFFRDAHEGFACGLWSLRLHTADGGAIWQTVTPLPAPDGGDDPNLFHIFGAPDGAVVVAAEGGAVLRGTEAGWSYLSSGYNGSLWTGVAGPGGALLVEGLRGTMLRREHGGATWQTVRSDLEGSVNGRLAVMSRCSKARPGL